MTNLIYLDHNFYLQSSFDKNTYNTDFKTVYICDKCNCISIYWDKIFYIKNVRYYQVASCLDHKDMRLTITCKEQQIKNLLE